MPACPQFTSDDFQSYMSDPALASYSGQNLLDAAQPGVGLTLSSNGAVTSSSALSFGGGRSGVRTPALPCTLACSGLWSFADTVLQQAVLCTSCIMLTALYFL